jgi:hypothetical protein
MKTVALLCAMLFLAATPAAGQWVPIVAKLKQTQEVYANGARIETRVREGNYYRTSDGSVLEEWTKIDGDTSRAVGYLVDNRRDLSYDVNFVTRTAIEKRIVLPPGVSGRPRTPVRPPAGREIIVGGLRCIALPAVVQKPTGPPLSAGETCVSSELSLLVRNDLTMPRPDGKSVRTLYELTDVQVHKEPDPKLFDLRARNFTVYSTQPR